jgi:hypothetical protein
VEFSRVEVSINKYRFRGCIEGFYYLISGLELNVLLGGIRMERYSWR